MSLWGQLFALGYDRCMAPVEDAGLAERRRALLREAHGRVLEVGAGTGANLAHYPAGVDELVLAEPEAPMAGRLQRRVAQVGVAATVVRAPAEALPFADAAFDVAVVTLVLCTVEDPSRALDELRRVLRPGGRLLFLEHVRAEDPGLARWQDRLTPLQRRVGHGCHLNRAPHELIAAGPWTLERLEHDRMPKAAPVLRPLVVGTALCADRP